MSESGIIKKPNGAEYQYEIAEDYHAHRCQQWENWVWAFGAKPVPILTKEILFETLKYRITCTHCSAVLANADLVEI